MDRKYWCSVNILLAKNNIYYWLCDQRKTQRKKECYQKKNVKYLLQSRMITIFIFLPYLN